MKRFKPLFWLLVVCLTVPTTANTATLFTNYSITAKGLDLSVSTIQNGNTPYKFSLISLNNILEDDWDPANKNIISYSVNFGDGKPMSIVAIRNGWVEEINLSSKNPYYAKYRKNEEEGLLQMVDWEKFNKIMEERGIEQAYAFYDEQWRQVLMGNVQFETNFVNRSANKILAEMIETIKPMIADGTPQVMTDLIRDFGSITNTLACEPRGKQIACWGKIKK